VAIAGHFLPVVPPAGRGLITKKNTPKNGSTFSITNVNPDEMLKESERFPAVLRSPHCPLSEYKDGIIKAVQRLFFGG